MYKMLFISESFEAFKAPWGAWCRPQPYNDGFIMPIGWEDELTKRGIAFEVIDMEENNDSI